MSSDPVAPVSAFRSSLDFVAPSIPTSTGFGGHPQRSPSPPPDGRLGHPTDEPQREMLLALVKDALESGHPGAALELLDRLWTADLAREDCWYLRGQLLYELKRFAEAGEVAGQGLARVPGSVALLYLLGNCELKLNNIAGAEKAIRDALALAPEHPVLLCRLAELLTRSGRLDEATTLVARAATAAPTHPLVAHERGALQAARERDATMPSIIENAPDAYGRAAIGMLLLGATPAAVAPKFGAEAVGGWWLWAVGAGLVGAVIALALLGHWVPAAVLLVTVLAGPLLWTARG
jgi:tetratricopeptide (TPR) repeat protein